MSLPPLPFLSSKQLGLPNLCFPLEMLCKPHPNRSALGVMHEGSVGHPAFSILWNRGLGEVQLTLLSCRSWGRLQLLCSPPLAVEPDRPTLALWQAPLGVMMRFLVGLHDPTPIHTVNVVYLSWCWLQGSSGAHPHILSSLETQTGS